MKDKRFSYLFVSIVTLVSLAAPAAKADALTTEEVESNLRTVAVSLARALAEEDARLLVAGALAETSERLYLANLLDDRLDDESLFAERLDAAYRACVEEKIVDSASEEITSLFAAMPGIEVFAAQGIELWDPAAEKPRVAFLAEGRDDDEESTGEAFDGYGDAVKVDPSLDPGFPVLVLEFHDLGEYFDWRAQLLPVFYSEPPEPETAGTCTTTSTYTSYPLITGAAITDIHENGVNGPEGFAYFTAAGDSKVGNVWSSLGGRSGWDTNVWASNFQGPVPVSKSRMQWEWTADGSLEHGSREYPAIYLKKSASSASGLTLTGYTVKEHDEWNPDDDLGQVRIDHAFCKTRVFDQGLSSGWTDSHVTTGTGDIDHVHYDLYCTKSSTCRARVSCPTGYTLTCSGGGTCSGNCSSGPDWVECNGHREYCGDPPCTIPGCQPQ